MADYARVNIDVAYLRVIDGAKRSRAGCLEHRYSCAKAGKYAQIRIGGANGPKYYCHILACIKKMGRVSRDGEEASHICGNAKCVNKDHVVFEDGLVNKSRLCCQLYLGKSTVYVCPHFPSCIVELENKC